MIRCLYLEQQLLSVKSSRLWDGMEAPIGGHMTNSNYVISVDEIKGILEAEDIPL